MAASWRRRKGKEGIGRRDASAIGARVSLTRLVLFHAIPPTERAKLRDADELASPTVLWTSVWSKPHPSSTHRARPEVKKKLPHRTVTVKSGAHDMRCSQGHIRLKSGAHDMRCNKMDN